MSNQLTRRDFIKKTLYTGAIFSGLAGTRVYAGPDFDKFRKQSPNEKLNIGIIGTGNRAVGNIEGVKGENIVALCDIDENFLNKMAANFPQAEKYRDFRKMLERKDLDAVVVSTADHTHAHASIMAMKLGMHCYCEKPLTHSVWEARQVAKVAAEYKRMTQMGTQIHASANYRRTVELVQSGAIGPVKEAHVWVAARWFDGRYEKSSAPPELSVARAMPPAHVDWDLWLGPAPEVGYQSNLHPQNWRSFWDFGSGTLGDMGCHLMDLVFWSLKLRAPETVWAEGPPVDRVGCPAFVDAHWQFAAREDMPAVTVHWHDGPKPPQILESLKEKDGSPLKAGMGVLFVGEKGSLFADYNQRRLFPLDKYDGFKAPEPFIKDSVGHYKEWIDAIKNGGTTTCNFDYAGALTECVLLGTVAYRSGEKLEWDAKKLKARGSKKAEEFMRREYRKEWDFIG